MYAEAQVRNFLMQAVRGEVSLSSSVIDEFVDDCRSAIEKQFNRNPEWRIRMSGLGHPLCQQINGRDGVQEQMEYNAILRFLIGDLTEAAVMAVLKGAGINVVSSQDSCELDIANTKVQGTLDLIMDDPVDGEKVWDVKSASPYSYSQKFGKGYDGLREDDPFGYIMQGILYSEAKGLPFGGWIVVDKSSGAIQFVEAPHDQSEDRDTYLKQAEETVKALMSNFTYKKPPISPEEETYKVGGVVHKTGNKLLNKSCMFCGYRSHCWPKALQHPKVTSKAKIPPLTWYHTLKVKQL